MLTFWTRQAHHAPFWPREATPAERADRVAAGVSANYGGDPANPRNRSVGVAAGQSCCLYLSNLVPGCTVAVLLGALGAHAPFGKVLATHLNPLSPAAGHPSGNGKITMFSREGAERLFSFLSAGRLFIGGARVRAAWNRHLAAPFAGDPWISRVLVVSGPPAVVDRAAIEAVVGAGCTDRQ